MLMAYDIVEDGADRRSHKQANRRFHEQDTAIRIGDLQIGGGDFVIIGPCAVESRADIDYR